MKKRSRRKSRFTVACSSSAHSNFQSTLFLHFPPYQFQFSTMRSWTILIATLLVLAPLRGVGAFPPLLPSKKGLYPPSSSSSSRKEAPIVSPTLDDSGWSPAILSTQYKQSRGAATAAAVGFLSGSVLLTPYYALADTELEMADLPPPWIPVLFGIGLLAVRLIRPPWIGVETCARSFDLAHLTHRPFSRCTSEFPLCRALDC